PPIKARWGWQTQDVLLGWPMGHPFAFQGGRMWLRPAPGSCWRDRCRDAGRSRSLSTLRRRRHLIDCSSAHHARRERGVSKEGFPGGEYSLTAVDHRAPSSDWSANVGEEKY